MKDIIREHYLNIKKLNKLNNIYKNIEKRVEEVAESMLGAHIMLNSDIAAQKYSDDIQGSGGKPCSSMDKEIENIYKQREKHLLNLKKEKAYIYNNILELESKISVVESAILHLDENEIRLLEARFKDHKTVRIIAYDMYCGTESVAYSKLKEVLAKIKIYKD